MSVGEDRIHKYLIDNNISHAREARFSTCKDSQQLPFDFAVYHDDKIECLIEYQGDQHYTMTGGWSDEEHLAYVQKHDEIKRQWARENSIPLLEIPYWELENIETILENTIKKRTR